MLKVKSLESKITMCELKKKVRKQNSKNRLRLFMLDGGKPNIVLIIMTLFPN